MKILSIGNSFSQDAHKWLSPVAQSCGDRLEAVNLYIGSCYLEKHWNLFCSGEETYSMERNGEFVRKISLPDALRLQDWDVITFQQASPQCGEYSTYQPYLSDLYQAVRSACPNARCYIHQTWAYETDCLLEAFGRYDRSQSRMYQQLKNAYGKAAEDLDVPVIPCGDAVQYLRRTVPEFDPERGGMPLTRDGYHLSLLYGRYAAALCWYGILTGKDVREVTFIPADAGEEADRALLRKIQDAVYTLI